MCLPRSTAGDFGEHDVIGLERGTYPTPRGSPVAVLEAFGELGHRECFTKADSQSAAFFKRSGSRSPDAAASSRALATLTSAKALSMGVASGVASHSCTAAFCTVVRSSTVSGVK